MYFHQVILLALAFLAFTAALNCTGGGEGWTSADFEEYLSLSNSNDSGRLLTNWGGMKKLKHCVLEESDWTHQDTPFEAQDYGREEDSGVSKNKLLRARGGDNYWKTWNGYACDNRLGAIAAVLSGFGCGICVTSRNIPMVTGYLWRQYISGDFPSVVYYPYAECRGDYIHYQGIYKNQQSSCDTFGTNSKRAWSAVLYQGC